MSSAGPLNLLGLIGIDGAEASVRVASRSAQSARFDSESLANGSSSAVEKVSQAGPSQMVGANKTALTRDDLCDGVEERLDEEIDEADLALGLQGGVRILDDRDGQLEARLEEGLLRPLLEQHRRPMLRDGVRSSLGRRNSLVSDARIRSTWRAKRTGLLMSEHLMSAWQIIMRSSQTSVASIEQRSSAILSPSSPSLTIQPKCIAMSVARIAENRILRKPVQSSAGPIEGRTRVALEAGPNRKVKPCLRSSVVMSRQCMFSRTDVSL